MLSYLDFGALRSHNFVTNMHTVSSSSSSTNFMRHKSQTKLRGRRQGRFKVSPGGRPPAKIVPPVAPPPIKFMIKHNLSLVIGGSLWQYTSAPPAAIMATPQ